MNGYIEIFEQTAVNYTHLLDGVEDTVSYFKTRELKQSVATTKTAEETDIILKSLNVRQYFDLLLGFKDVTNPKPAPRLFRIASEKAGCSESELLHVGDSLEDDIMGAINTGIKCVWLNRNKVRNDLGFKIDYEISSLLELLEILKIE